ncbi:Cys-every-fifth RiPP peptide CefA [Streptomyces sp. SHP 1-2]|uniref:Cys-every-fifth RiPP peptide CefA n=1 Tax=Streptomyces sp. SHP 1-2 TaxID=2769489 RepID=UPI0039E06045
MTAGPMTACPVTVRPMTACPVTACPVAGCPVAGCPVAGCPVAGCPVAGCPVAGCRGGDCGRLPPGASPCMPSSPASSPSTHRAYHRPRGGRRRCSALLTDPIVGTPVPDKGVGPPKGRPGRGAGRVCRLLPAQGPRFPEGPSGTQEVARSGTRAVPDRACP